MGRRIENLDRPISELLKSTPEKRAIEQGFFDGAARALQEARVSAREFLAANPHVSNIELAKRLRNYLKTDLGGLLSVG